MVSYFVTIYNKTNCKYGYACICL